MDSKLKEKRGFEAEVKQLLHIVVHSLYSNKEIFLRELLSNASDASDKLRFLAITQPDVYGKDPHLKIRLSYDKKAQTLTIADNGIGLSREEVIDNLGTIAKSGTREFLAQMTGDQKKDATLIGQFGVGFYSAFMVADSVTVNTRKYDAEANESVSWQSTGDGEYTIESIEKPERGTEIILKLKDTETEFLDQWRLRNIISRYSDHLNIPIEMQKLDDKEEPTTEWEVVNQAKALWTLPKASITESQYQEFYKYISHDYEAPLAYTHNKIEGGNIDYTALLFLPARPPFDLFQQDKHFGLKLYVQRVFILDHVEQFLPHYLRFMRGIIDTNALPLNISREILQDHPTLNKLKGAITRHSLDMLEKLATAEPEKYQQFWQAFGNVLKEGPAEDHSNLAKIAKLLRFTTTRNSASQTVSLTEYLKNMPETQTKIYYVTAENIPAALGSPHLEIFKKNNIEVLLLTDRIDEWLMSHLNEFEGKSFQSVAKGDLALNEFPEADPDKQEKTEEDETALNALIQKMKTTLGDKVKEVRLSHRLTESPVCLVRDHDALGPQMERMLKAAGQPIGEAKPIFELNPAHQIIKKLQVENNNQLFQEWVTILFEQALLSEGSHLQDPAAFVKRLNKLWMENL
ncbi:MAG: molecular chaperone HtpG [Gammaproteobacteria bacterium]|nr:molecular chaperone HtpG [Gammaproteobacteria bacterium]